jgi:RimJ/RimL family protein N-acetyltransferase
MMSIIETPRLILREWNLHDAESMYHLNLNPEVIQYTGDVPFTSIEDSALFISNYDHYIKYGYGRWVVIHKETKHFLGWCGLKYTEEFDESDIGFRFFKMYWNMGYATESASACIHYGFEKLNLQEIIGRAVKANTASIRVLEKIGMTFYKELSFHGFDGVIYKIQKKNSV